MAEKKEKREISVILKSEDRDWHKTEEILPEKNHPVVVRLYNKDIIYGQDENEIYYAEDVKIGYIDDNGEWKISPPFPKYDFSPLSRNDHLLNNTVISHWAKCENGEIEGWKTRFNPIGNCTQLSIRIDKEHEADLYRACLLAANYVARSTKDFGSLNPHQGTRRMYEIFIDIQSCIDNNADIEDGMLKYHE